MQKINPDTFKSTLKEQYEVKSISVISLPNTQEICPIDYKVFNVIPSQIRETLVKCVLAQTF